MGITSEDTQMKICSYIDLFSTRFTLTWGGTLLLIVLLAGCSDAHSEQPRSVVDGAGVDGAVLAEVAGETIDTETFRTRYVDYLFKTGLQDEDANRKRVLNSLIDEFLLVQDARRAGIEEDPRYVAAHQRHRTKFLVESFVKEALFDTLQIAEDELKDMFIRAQTTLTARHLYAGTIEQAEALYNRLQAGETFDTLAKEVFADTTLANNGGFLGEFTLDDMDLAFEEAAYALKEGEISKPVKTSKGYSIIKLESRFTKPLITEYEYAERRDRMMHFVSYRKKTSARVEYVSQLMEAMQPRYAPDTFDRLLGQITGAMPVQGGDAGEAWLSDALVTYSLNGNTRTLDVAGFRELAALTTEEQRSSVTNAQGLEEFANGLLVRNAMVEEALRLELDDTPLFRQALASADRAWIRDNVATATLQSPDVPEDSIRGYFDRYKDEFVRPPTTRLWEILLDNKQDADRLAPQLNTGSFEMLARMHSIRPRAEETGGDLGYLTLDQMGVMRTHAINAGTGDVLGPIELKGHYVFLKVGDRQPARPLSYEEARPEILTRMRKTLGRENLQDRIRALRAANEITIDYALLSTLSLKTLS